MKSILVTGGCGFIGSNFIRYLLQNPVEPPESVVNLDSLTYAGNPANLEGVDQHPSYHFVKGDIGDAALVESLFDKYGICGVINFAAESHVDRSIDSPEPFFQTNVIGTLRLLDIFRKEAADKEGARFLHVSTDEVYGSLSPEDPAFTEATPYAPNSPYSASKASSDFIVRAAYHTYGLPVVTTNCSNNYGPYQFPEKLVPLMILNALEEKELPIYGDGSNVRDWLYVEDHCRGIWEVFKKGRLGETYNIGGLNEKKNIEIVDTICAILDSLRPRKGGGSYQTLKKFVKDRPGHDKRYAIDCGKIGGELGWKPAESFETGIEKTIRWYLDNRDWCAAITEKNYQRQRLGLK